MPVTLIWAMDRNRAIGGDNRMLWHLPADMAFFRKIDGVPLKLNMNMPDGTMTMEATHLKRESLPSSDFIIPSDYKEVKSAF